MSDDTYRTPRGVAQMSNCPSIAPERRPPTPSPDFSLDLGCALDLLAETVQERGAGFAYQPVWMQNQRYLTRVYANDRVASRFVGEVLLRAGAMVAQLESLRDDDIRELYPEGKPPIRLSLGTVKVLHRAQESHRRGMPWERFLADAQAAAYSFLDQISLSYPAAHTCPIATMTISRPATALSRPSSAATDIAANLQARANASHTVSRSTKTRCCPTTAHVARLPVEAIDVLRGRVRRSGVKPPAGRRWITLRLGRSRRGHRSVLDGGGT